MSSVTGVENLNKELEKLAKKLGSKESKKIYRRAAKVYTKAAETLAPRAPGNVHRYSTPKLNGKLKAPKGSGVIAATYTPGNLGRSIKELSFSRKLKRALYIGPKRARRTAPGTVFKGKKVDGFYALMNEYGTKNRQKKPFIKKAWNQSKGLVSRLILEGLRKKALQ